MNRRSPSPTTSVSSSCQRPQPRQRVRRRRPRSRRRSARLARGLLRRAHDRRVAGAAAEIAGERVVDRRLVRQRRRPSRVSANIDMTKPGVQKPHCEPWQSTIACCTGCRLPSGCLQVLDREQLAAVERGHELDAGIDRPVVEPVALGPAERRRCRRRSRPRCSLPWCRSAARSSRSQSSTVMGRVDPVELAQLVAEEEADCGCASNWLP